MTKAPQKRKVRPQVLVKWIFVQQKGSFARSYPLSRQLARGLEIQPNDGSKD